MSGAIDDADSALQQSRTCRWANCWRDGATVTIADGTGKEAILCDEHRRLFLGVSS